MKNFLLLAGGIKPIPFHPYDGEGVIIETHGTVVSLTGLISLSNSDSGVNITSDNALAKISILSGLFMGNGVYGIDVDKYGLNLVVLTGTSYFGNATGYLYVH